MAFYRPDSDLNQALAAVLEDCKATRPGLDEQLSITWLVYDASPIDLAAGLDSQDVWSLPIRGAAHRSGQQRYPASVVKLAYAMAVEQWLARDLLLESPELRRAMQDMIGDSSNDATSLVMDLLSGTTSGPELPPDPFSSWARQRQLVNQWFASLGWPEWQGSNACQKTWGEGPYGRERQFYGAEMENRNRLSTDITARMLHAVLTGAWVSPLASARLRDLLSRSLDLAERKADPENQVDGFLGGGLPVGSRLWSKAGWMSQARHDAAYIETPGCKPFLVVAFSEGPERAADESLLPELTQRLIQASALS